MQKNDKRNVNCRCKT